MKKTQADPTLPYNPKQLLNQSSFANIQSRDKFGHPNQNLLRARGSLSRGIPMQEIPDAAVSRRRETFRNYERALIVPEK